MLSRMRRFSPKQVRLRLLPWIEQGGDDGPQAPTIVGLWHLTYTQEDGSPFNQTSKPGTPTALNSNRRFSSVEAEISALGVERTGLRTVKLITLVSLFAPDGSIAGSFTIRRNPIRSLGMAKTYKGTFRLQKFV